MCFLEDGAGVNVLHLWFAPNAFVTKRRNGEDIKVLAQLPTALVRQGIVSTLLQRGSNAFYAWDLQQAKCVARMAKATTAQKSGRREKGRSQTRAIQLSF